MYILLLQVYEFLVCVSYLIVPFICPDWVIRYAVSCIVGWKLDVGTLLVKLLLVVLPNVDVDLL